MWCETCAVSRDYPMPVFAFVDCNNFYASCEKLFRPDLKDTPVVVLSNNDGCVVARSREAKLLGIKRAYPSFKSKLKCSAMAFWHSRPTMRCTQI